MTNNIISDCWSGAIYVDFQGVPDAGGDIADNTITTRPDSHPWAAVEINGGGIFNIAYNVITGHFNHGIIARGLESSALIIGNMINSPDGSGKGIHAYKGEYTISENLVTGSFSQVGIEVAEFYGMVTSNTITSPPGSSGAGIAVWEGEPAISDNTIGSGEEGYFDVGIYLENVGPAGMVSGNSVLAPMGVTRPHAIQIIGGEPAVESNTFGGNFEQVIRVEEESTAKITNHKHPVAGNYGVYCVNSEPHINYNNIQDNTEYSVYNETPEILVDAENNWWGHETGPYHPDLNPDGEGDRVSDGVDFEPWLLEPVDVRR